MARQTKRGWTMFLFLAVAGIAAAVYGAGQGKWFEQSEVESGAGAPVQRGPLRISEVVRGNLEAKNSIHLRSEIENEVAILELVTQGPIAKGALVAAFDVADIVDKQLAQEIDVKSAEAEFVKAKEQYEIQVIQNETDIAAAKLALEFAIQDHAKYVHSEGEQTHELEAAKEDIALAQETLAQAVEEHEWTEKLAAKGFAQENQVKQDKLTMQRRETEVRQAQRALKLLEDFNFKRREMELQADVETKRRDVLKTEKQAIARLADYESEREAARYELAREREVLARYEDQISKSKIIAPEDGILVYGRTSSRHGMSNPIEEGTVVRKGQEIATIPRSGGMVAEASLHETKLEKIGAGQRCLIQVDALPGEMFEGRVDNVAILPESGGWMSDPNQRLYPAEILITDGTAEMRPGMSCNVEIVIEDLVDVLYVPRQCVFLDGSDPVCFVQAEDGAEMRVIEPGLANTKAVEIKSGLAEGEIVLLAPPAWFEPSRGDTAPGGEELPDWNPDRDEAGSGPDGMNPGGAPGAHGAPAAEE